MQTELNMHVIKLISYFSAFYPAEIDCGDIAHPQNGEVSFSNTTYNSVANYSCNTGYNLTGDVTRTCLNTSLWSDSEPTCISELTYFTRMKSLILLGDCMHNVVCIS